MNHTHRRRKTRLLPITLCLLALLFGGVFIFWSLGGGERDTADARPTVMERARGVFSLQARGDQGAVLDNFPHAVTQVSVSEITDTQYLKLVNRDRALQTPVSNARLVSAWPAISVRATDVTLHETAKEAMRQLYEAAGRTNLRPLFIASGFRSTEEQQYLYQNAVDRSYVMPPGHSEHQLGLAADILATGSYSTGGMAGSDEAVWLAQNAPQFGLILRYPYHKQDITGVPYEPWHFRYVGRVHAHIMGRYDFVLEEYIAFLQANGSYQTTFDGKTFYVLYQRPQNGMISVPEELSFNVSSANTGGFIVTAWR